jgi:hypothetical protein
VALEYKPLPKFSLKGECFQPGAENNNCSYRHTMHKNSQEPGFLKTYQYPAPTRKTSLILFAAVFLLELAGGVYLGYFKETVVGDAFSRTANAFYVFFIEPPRFASIGLVWNPLPSVLQLPFVIWAGIWKPVVTHGIAAAIVNSLFAAGTVLILFRAFVRLKVASMYTAVFLFLYASNPFIYYYGFNGMSEGIFFFFTVYVVLCVTLWMKEGTPDYIVRIAFALALAFFCRYEAVPFAVAVGIGALIIIFFGPHEKAFIPAADKKERYFYAEGTAIVLYTPFFFSVLLWILFNWVISGDPLYFLTSAYSNTAQSQYAPPVDTPWEAMSYVAGKTAPFIPIFVGVVIVRLLNGRLLRHDFFVLLVMVVAMLSFHYVMLLKGSSYGWVRFFSYVLPISFAWLPYELSQTVKSGYAQKLACIVLLASLLVSWGLTKIVLADPQSDERTGFVTSEPRRIANYMNENLSEEKILAYSFMTYGTILSLNDMSNMVVSASLDFYDVVDNPRRYGITYILVPEPEGIGQLDTLNTRYPGLYAGKEDWCSEAKAFDGFKLFKVIY